MKSAAFILPLLMIFLAVHPVISMYKMPVQKEACAKKSCCGMKSDHSKQEQKESRNAMPCNPFAFCAGCIYLNTATWIDVAALTNSPAEKILLPGVHILSCYDHKPWQPPEWI